MSQQAEKHMENIRWEIYESLFKSTNIAACVKEQNLHARPGPLLCKHRVFQGEEQSQQVL